MEGREQWSLQCVCVCSIGQLSGQCADTQSEPDKDGEPRIRRRRQLNRVGHSGGGGRTH